MLVFAQKAESGDVKVERPRRFDVQLHPGDGDSAEEMTMGEGEDAALACGNELDEILRPRIDLGRRLAAWTSVFVELPVRPRLVDLLGGLALVLAVVDLAKQRGQVRLREARDLGCAPGALERARVDDIEVNLVQAIPQASGLVFAMRRQGQIGCACVASVETPLGLTVAGEIYLKTARLRAQAGLPIISGLPDRKDRLALSITAPARTRWPGRTQTNPTVA